MYNLYIYTNWYNIFTHIHIYIYTMQTVPIGMPFKQDMSMSGRMAGRMAP